MSTTIEALVDRVACATLDVCSFAAGIACGFRHQSVRLNDGQSAHFLHKAGSSRRTPFVVLPGLSMDAQHTVSLMMPWMQDFCGIVPLGVPADVPVYVIELPGHGRSADQRSPATFTECASYILAVLDRLEPRGPLILGGYSLGGALVLNIAALLEHAVAGGASERIERIVLLAPAIAPTRSFHARINPPTPEARRDSLRGTHAYEGLHECRRFFEEYGGLPQPNLASICWIKGVVPVIGLLAHIAICLMLRAFACARRRDYPADHFAHLMEHLTRSTLERRVAAGIDEAAASAWPDTPLGGMRLMVDPELWGSLGAVFSCPASSSSSPPPQGARPSRSIPTLLVIAERDAVCDPDHLSRLASEGHLGGQCTVHVVKGAGHIFVPSQLATLFDSCGPVIGRWLGFEF